MTSTERRRFPELDELLRRIVSVYDPLEVVLFGSRARGDATADSDWDLLVLVPDGAPERLLDPMLGWRTQEGSGVRADVVCARISEHEADVAVANTLAREIADHAVVLLSVPVPGFDRGG